MKAKKTIIKPHILRPSELDKCLDNLDIEPVLKSSVRQVKWLYLNSNKMTMVYDEKLVRAIIQRLKERIYELENK